jgi:hypothetical protein
MSFGKRPEEEFYRIDRDPDCMHNLASDPEYSATKEWLRKKMEADLIAQGDPRMLGQGDLFDRYPYVGKPFNYETKQEEEPGK